MIVKKAVLKSSLSYSDDERRRYSLSIEWEKGKKKACVIMLCAGRTNGIFFDRTTNHVVQNLVELDYGSVDILNLFSSVDGEIDSESDSENLKAIDISAKNADTIIFAAGTGHQSNKKVQIQQKAVLAILNRCNKKMYCIADDEGKKFYHPLCPKVQKWNLTEFDIAEIIKKGNDND